MDEVRKNDMDLPFGFRQQPVDDRLREENWKAVEDAIRQQENMPAAGAGRKDGARVIRLGRIVAAAACVIAFAFGIWWIGARTGHLQYSLIKTGYGEIKTIILPDSSIVTLNANSSMRIPDQWEKSGRQVWLEGEAYFQVQKKPATVEKFTVHTRQVNVEVLGTKFNVNARRERAVVSLEEGKVRLSMNGSDSAVLEKRSPVVMRPGQVVVIDAAKREATVNDENNVAAHSGWTKHEFHFDNTLLSQIDSLIQENYGYRMEVEDPAMMQVSLSGDMRVANVEEMTKLLEASSGYTMRIKGKTIYVTYH